MHTASRPANAQTAQSGRSNTAHTPTDHPPELTDRLLATALCNRPAPACTLYTVKAAVKPEAAFVVLVHEAIPGVFSAFVAATGLPGVPKPHLSDSGILRLSHVQVASDDSGRQTPPPLGAAQAMLAAVGHASAGCP